MKPAIRISNLCYNYRSHWTYRRRAGLNNINLEVQAGESFGFLGHNGAGKTTTIKCLLDLIKPASGSIEIFGVNSRLPQSRQAVGFVPEQPYFYDHLRVDELLHLYATLHGYQGDLNTEIDRVLELLKISTLKNARMRSLSKGLTQRVGLAQALLGAPRLLVLDEPFSGLDPLGRREIADLLFQQKRQGVTIFVSSHVLSDIEFLCDRFSIMVQGEIKAVHKVSDLPNLLKGIYYLKVKNFNEIEEQLSALADQAQNQDKFLHLEFATWEQAQKALILASQRAVVDEFRFRHGGVEELFLQLTKDLKR